MTKACKDKKVGVELVGSEVVRQTHLSPWVSIRSTRSKFCAKKTAILRRRSFLTIGVMQCICFVWVVVRCLKLVKVMAILGQDNQQGCISEVEMYEARRKREVIVTACSSRSCYTSYRYNAG